MTVKLSLKRHDRCLPKASPSLTQFANTGEDPRKADTHTENGNYFSSHADSPISLGPFSHATGGRSASVKSSSGPPNAERFKRPARERSRDAREQCREETDEKKLEQKCPLGPLAGDLVKPHLHPVIGTVQLLLASLLPHGGFAFTLRPLRLGLAD